MTTVTARSNGDNVPLLLFVVFLILRLTGCIDWSWWWVTSPLWIPVIVVLVVALGAAAVLPGVGRTRTGWSRTAKLRGVV